MRYWLGGMESTFGERQFIRLRRSVRGEFGRCWAMEPGIDRCVQLGLPLSAGSWDEEAWDSVVEWHPLSIAASFGFQQILIQRYLPHDMMALLIAPSYGIRLVAEL
jgi:hypothetical protein